MSGEEYELHRIKIMINRIEVLKSELAYWKKEAELEHEQLRDALGGGQAIRYMTLRELYDLYKEQVKSDK